MPPSATRPTSVRRRPPHRSARRPNTDAAASRRRRRRRTPGRCAPDRGRVVDAEEQREHRLEHRDRAAADDDRRRARRDGGLAQHRARRGTALAARASAVGSRTTGTPSAPTAASAGDGQERQPRAAEFVQPAAERRADHEPERRCRTSRGPSRGRARSAPYRSAISAKPTTHVTASAAPCTRRAANSHGSAVGEREQQRRRPRARPGRRRAAALRPMRSETAPIGIDTREQRHAERREQQPDHRRRRAEPPAQIRQHRHGDRIREDVGEGREA